jgi:CubicO group peptidase (beta-lactamase class C family)
VVLTGLRFCATPRGGGMARILPWVGMHFRIGSLLVSLLCVVACSSSETESSGGTSGGDGQGGQAELPGCEAERKELERVIAEKLDAAAADPAVTGEPNFTLGLETARGYRFVHTHGDSTLATRYESASTSKWVAASVILDLVDQGVLTLDDSPAEYLPFWKAEGVTLAQLLSFTSGFSKEALCFNLPTADFAGCVEKAYEANVDIAPAPGSEFDYSSTHLQIAGLMAVRAAQVDGFAELFRGWQQETGLFPSGAFDLPSATNPRLAGGMHWTGEEYLGFLRALYDGELLEAATRESMLESQRGDAKVVGSPPLEALGQDWAYGFGNWLECPTALGADSYDCGSGHRNSSPGAYGAYPFIDWDRRYFGILARQGELGTFRDGDSLFQVAAEAISRWATVCE